MATLPSLWIAEERPQITAARIYIYSRNLAETTDK